MIDKIQTLLENTLPKGTEIIVRAYKGCFGGQYVKIVFAASNHKINGLAGQFPQAVSLNLDLADLELGVQVFGGMGGNRIYCIPNKENPSEKFLAMAGRKVAFRKPKKEEKFVLNAIKKFAENWIKTLKENREVLEYQNDVDYNALLK